MPDDPRPPAQVVNLWVYRQELAREADDQRLLWRCSCDSLLFLYYAVEGMVCANCGKQSTKPGKW